MSTSSPEQQPLKPSQVDEGLSWFDRLSSMAATAVARSYFFAACVLTIVVWAPTIIWLQFDTWQLLINTWTTLVTYLLVALLQNTQSRDSKAMHRKLNALAEGLIDIMEAHRRDDETMRDDIDELRQAVGLEHREGS